MHDTRRLPASELWNVVSIPLPPPPPLSQTLSDPLAPTTVPPPPITAAAQAASQMAAQWGRAHFFVFHSATRAYKYHSRDQRASIMRIGGSVAWRNTKPGRSRVTINSNTVTAPRLGRPAARLVKRRPWFLRFVYRGMPNARAGAMYQSG